MSKTALIYAAEHSQLEAAHYLAVRGTMVEKVDFYYLGLLAVPFFFFFLLSTFAAQHVTLLFTATTIGFCGHRVCEMIAAGQQMAEAIRIARAESGGQ